MKKILSIVAVMALTNGAFAKTVSGTSTVTDMISQPTMMTISISGESARKVFNDLSDDLLVSLSDASENGGTRVVQKAGRNITCSLSIKSLGKSRTSSKYRCEISIVDKAEGVIGHAGVG